MNTENRCVPFIDKTVGRVGKGALSGCIVLFPIGSAHIPVGKPHLFGLQILHFHVEDTVVGNEGLETFVVMTGQPIDGESTEAGTHAT